MFRTFTDRERSLSNPIVFFARQAYVVLGLFMQLVYLVYYESWAIAIPLATEVALLVYLLGLWYYLEVFRAKGAVIALEEHNDEDAVALEYQDGVESARGHHSAI